MAREFCTRPNRVFNRALLPAALAVFGLLTPRFAAAIEPLKLDLSLPKSYADARLAAALLPAHSLEEQNQSRLNLERSFSYREYRLAQIPFLADTFLGEIPFGYRNRSLGLLLQTSQKPEAMKFTLGGCKGIGHKYGGLCFQKNF